MTFVPLTRVPMRALVSVVATPALLLALAACGGGESAAPPVPEVFTKTAGDEVSAAVATTTPSSPTLKVTDDDGRAVKGVVVNFVVAGGGSIVAATDTTDASGLATSGAWTLGTTMGPQTVTATSPSVAGATATFRATASAGAPFKLGFASQPPLSLRAGESFTGLVVEVQDRYGNRTSSTATVSLSLASSGTGTATLLGTTSVAAVDGRATFGPLSTSSTGVLSLVASSSDVSIGSAISNGMTVAAGLPTQLLKIAGDVQQGAAGTSAFLPPMAKLVDQFGNPVEGAQVTFSVVSGGGSVSNTTAIVGADGIAKVTKWTLGPSAGTNVVRAMAGSLQADFTATALAASPYHIELRYINLPTRRQQEAFESAWRKWRSVITGDIPDWNFTGTSLCGRPAAPEVFDDLVIYVNLAPIDGPGSVLGSAGPCGANGANFLPYVGNMTFDTADLASLESSGQLDQVIVHEMGHVLGIGIGQLWGPNAKGLLQFAGTDSVSFNGTAAKAVWQSLGGAAGTRVPMESCVGIPGCGSGTRDSHWREPIFKNELMTGYLNGGVANPLSALTIAALQDFGYTVNTSAAESYTLPTSIMAGGAGGSGSAGIGTSLRALVEAKPTWDIIISERNGRNVPIDQWVRQNPGRIDAMRLEH